MEGCEFCNESKIMITKEVENSGLLYWCKGKEITRELLNDCIQKGELIIHIDRGYLRLSNPDDNNCLDHGEKIKINYCPICGFEI